MILFPNKVQRKYLREMGCSAFPQFLDVSELDEHHAHAQSQHPEESDQEAMARAIARLAWKQKGHRRLFVYVIVIAILLFCASKAHAQRGVDGIQVQDSSGAPIKSWFGGIAKLRCSVNMNCSVSGGTVSFSGGAGLIQSGLLAEYRMTEGSGTTLVDYSGSGNSGTFGAAAKAPTWISGTGGINVTGGQYVSLPAALNAAATIQIFAYSSSSTTYTTYPMLIGTTTAGQGIELAMWASYNGTVGLGGEFYSLNPSVYHAPSNTFKSESGTTMNGYKLISWVLDSTSDLVYINGDEVPFYMARAGNAGVAANNYNLGASTRGNCAVCYWTGPIYYALFYNRELSAAEISQNYAYVSQALISRGLNISPGTATYADSTDNVVFAGDSITWGNLATPYTSSLTLNGSWNIVNLGVSGWQVKNLIAEGSTRANTFFKPYAGKNLLVVFAGTNDFAIGGASATTTANRTAEYCRNQRLAGWRVLVATMISRNGLDTGKKALNLLIRQNWTTYADGLVDLAANANLGADSAYSNTTYFSDGIHPTNAGQLIIADIMSRVINAQYGNLLNSATLNTATGTYTEVDADVFVRADPSGGNVTVTLPSAIGTTGQIRYIKNIQSVGANTVTVAAAGSENIDGAASVTVANLGFLAVKSTLDSLTAGGAHWEKVN